MDAVRPLLMTGAIFMALTTWTNGEEADRNAQVGAATRPARIGVGILGDSYSDEYEFYPPHRSAARNWMEILATTRGQTLDFGTYSRLSRGEPRNQGYAYNWARSDATSVDMIATGQHTGLAEQVARGEVQVAWIFIGGNDFIHLLQAPDPEKRLDEVATQLATNHKLAVSTILNAHPAVRVVLGTIPDVRNLPEFEEPIRSGKLPQALIRRTTAAIRRFNQQVRAMDQHPRVAVVDLDLVVSTFSLLSRDRVILAGRSLDRIHPGDEPDRVFLGDVRHPGTIVQGLLAQRIQLALQGEFGMDVKPVLLREIYDFADKPPVNPAPFRTSGNPLIVTNMK